MTPSRQMRSFCYTTKSKNEERFVGAGFHLVSEEVLVSCLNQKQIILT